MTTLLIATRNAHKVREISQMTGGEFRCLALNDLPGAPDAVEDAETFAGNAMKKALTLARWLAKNPGAVPGGGAAEEQIFILADDSGLEVDALGGAPGVHSARFAASQAPGSGNAPDAANNAKLLRLLEGIPPQQRTARFRCVLAILPVSRRSPPAAAGQIILFDGVCEGTIRGLASGRGGFGYDPLFVPAGCTKSFAELGEDAKNELSHRALALKKLKEFMAKGTVDRS